MQEATKISSSTRLNNSNQIMAITAAKALLPRTKEVHHLIRDITRAARLQATTLRTRLGQVVDHRLYKVDPLHFSIRTLNSSMEIIKWVGHLLNIDPVNKTVVVTNGNSSQTTLLPKITINSLLIVAKHCKICRLNSSNLDKTGVLSKSNSLMTFSMENLENFRTIRQMCAT